MRRRRGRTHEVHLNPICSAAPRPSEANPDRLALSQTAEVCARRNHYCFMPLCYAEFGWQYLTDRVELFKDIAKSTVAFQETKSHSIVNYQLNFIC